MFTLFTSGVEPTTQEQAEKNKEVIREKRKEYQKKKAEEKIITFTIIGVDYTCTAKEFNDFVTLTANLIKDLGDKSYKVRKTATDGIISIMVNSYNLDGTTYTNVNDELRTWQKMDAVKFLMLLSYMYTEYEANDYEFKLNALKCMRSVLDLFNEDRSRSLSSNYQYNVQGWSVKQYQEHFFKEYQKDNFKEVLVESGEFLGIRGYLDEGDEDDEYYYEEDEDW
jgi:transcriptional regulator of aromatic amino acid metabolism